MKIQATTLAYTDFICISGKSACGKKEAEPCGTLVRTVGIASRFAAAGIRRYDVMEADGEPPQRG
jgi:hypothetical protein